MAKKAYIGAPNFEKRNLPSGYTQVEYIESTGTQYIDTGFTVNSSNYVNLKIEYETIYTSLSGTYYKVHGISGSGLIFYVGCSNSGVVVYGNGKSDQTTSLKGTLGKKTKVVFDMKNKTYTFDGNTVNITATAPSSSGNFHIFGYNKLNGGTDCHEEKICSFKIYNNGVLARDYVPCKNSSGTVGLYDMVNKTFNAGVGTFVAGSSENPSTARKVKKAYIGIQQFEPRELPEGYTQVAYIESSGTQYVDTGFKPNQDTRVVAEMELTNPTNSEWYKIFGYGASSSKTKYNLWIDGKGTTQIHYGSTYKEYSDSSKMLNIDMNQNVTTINDIVATNSVQTFQAAGSMFIFDITDYPSYLRAIVKLYSFKIYDNGTLVRDYVPCTNQTGVGGLYDLANMKFYGNNGTGTFAVGASGSTAHRIKKGYIGIGGVARPFMSGGELAYYGTITDLSQARGYLAATTVGNYALFGGGYSGSYWGKVDAYNTSLTRTTATDFSRTRRQLAATTVGNYALFGGGYNGSAARANVDTYDTSLTKGTATALTHARYNHAATTVGNYALFGGGQSDEGTAMSGVNAYNASLTRTSPTNLLTSVNCLAATTVGDYALFSGGKAHNGTPKTKITCYNSSLSQNSTELSVARYYLAATTVGNYALFAGGSYATDGSATDAVDAYNASLTRTTATTLSQKRCRFSATTVGNYALFGGGNSNGTLVGTVDVYDTSLTRTTTTDLCVARQDFAATSIGNYALFGGGWNEEKGTYYSTVDAYVVA